MNCENCKKGEVNPFSIRPGCQKCGCECGTQPKQPGICRACTRRITRRQAVLQAATAAVVLAFAVVSLLRWVL